MRKAKNTVSGVTCTKCGGTNIRTAELIFSGGKYKQQYKCRDCGRRFFDPNEIKYKKSDIIKEGLNQIRLNKKTDQVKYICPYCENILDYDEKRLKSSGQHDFSSIVHRGDCLFPRCRPVTVNVASLSSPQAEAGT